MALPKIDQPLFEVTIPSTRKNVLFRPFLVKEEKILLVAQSSNVDTDIMRAIKQILQLCITDKIKIDDLTTFDLEYLFLKLRAKSVNNIVKLSYRDIEDEKVYDFELDLDTIEVEMPTDIDPKIEITDKVGMIMKYPSASITDRIREFENEVDLMSFFIINCIDSIYTEDEVFMASEYTEEELTEFLDGISIQAFEKVRMFFEKLPKLYHKFEYKNSLGNDRTVELNTVRDFFMWR